jgi:DNA-binding response OmpR family regulator
MGSDPRPPDQAPLVLIVEHDDSNRELFQFVLEHAGMRVLLARNVDETQAFTANATPDVVVTDVRMPLGDGAAFIRSLRVNPAFDGVPVLFVTGFLLADDDLHHLEDHGPVEAVLKPFKPEVLVKFVRALLAQAASSTAASRGQVLKDRASRLRASSEQLSKDSHELIDNSKHLLHAKTVLLVEDDGAFRYAMGRMLRGAGANVVETGNLENALVALNQRPEIEAIVADVLLPDGLAPDGLKQFEQQRQLPVLYVTGYSDQLLRDYGLSAQDPHLLIKPFDAVTLVSRLAALGA